MCLVSGFSRRAACVPVTIRVDGQRNTEIIKYVTTTDAVVSPDLLQGFIKQVITPLSVLQFVALDQSSTDPYDTLWLDQKAAFEKLNKTAAEVNSATAEVACLQTFNAYKDNVCTQEVLKPDASEQAAWDASATITIALLQPLPIGDVASFDDRIKGLNEKCARGSCPTKFDQALQNQARLKAGINDVQGALASLAKAQATLDAVQDFSPVAIPPISNAANKKATIKVTAQEQLGKTSADVATIVITWQSTNWELSTGILLSSLVNRSFSNAPIYNPDGTPSGDGSGKVLTKVSVSPTYPSVVFPLVMVDFKLHTFQKYEGKWSIVASGGIGANLSSKTTDFAGGPSLQYRSILITPSFHYGRQAQLTNGVHLGDRLGTSPPALPVQNQWRPAGGLAISYVLPIP